MRLVLSLARGCGRHRWVCVRLSAGSWREWGSARKPNFILIVTDDQRWDTLGVVQREQGERVRFPFLKTPNLDRLAAEGVRFRYAFVVNSLCAPSRATFLTILHRTFATPCLLCAGIAATVGWLTERRADGHSASSARPRAVRLGGLTSRPSMSSSRHVMNLQTTLLPFGSGMPPPTSRRLPGRSRS